MERITGSVTVEGPGAHLPMIERWLSAGVGILAALFGLRQKGSFGLSLLAAGGYLLYRGVTGRCRVYELLGFRGRADSDLTPVKDKPPSVVEGDKVTESSWESFPTSDPPSWTTGREDDVQ